MATAVKGDYYLQQIHTARTQLHASFKRAHELLIKRESDLIKELETIERDHEARYNSMQDELQGLEASKQALKNNLRDNDLLNKALADINHKMDEILKLSEQTIKFQWNTDLNKDLRHAGEVIFTLSATSVISRYSNMIPDFSPYSNVAPSIPKHSNVTPDIPKHSDVTPTVPKHSNLKPVIPKHYDMTPDIPKYSNVTPPIPKHSNVTPPIPKYSNVTPPIPKHSNVKPVIPAKPDNLTHVIPQPAIPDYKNKSAPIITCCREGTSPGELYCPAGLAIEPQSGRIYIADHGNDRIQVFTPNGEYCFMFSSCNMRGPWGICINNDTVYVSQYRGNCIASHKLEGACVNKVGIWGARNGQFNCPRGLAVSPITEHLYVCDRNNHRVQVFDKDLKFHSIFSNNVNDPIDINFTNDLVIVLDEGDPCVHIFSITDHSLLNSIISRGTREQISNPSFFTMDVDQYLLLTDYNMHCVRMFNLTGGFKAKIGKRGHATGEFIKPAGIVIDGQNRIIVVSMNKYASLQIF